MDYKTILVHVGDPDGSPERIGFAARLAVQQRAHLVGLTHTGIANFVRDTSLLGVDLRDVTPLFADLREAAERRVSQFDLLAGQAAVASYEHRVDDEDPRVALALRALYADLVVVGQDGRTEESPAGGAGLAEYVALHSPAPVLVLPRGWAQPPVFERVLLAWKASPESARALRLALPLLVRARTVELALFEEPGTGTRAPQDATDAALFLSRYGVQADVSRLHPHGGVGDALLALAETRKAELLVMGCYGHSRYREILLGGVSRTILRRLPLPVLLAH